MSTVTVDVQELPGKLADLLVLIRAGTEVILRDGPFTAKLVLPATREWIFGMHPGSMVMAPDFNDPLPDEFWEGDPETDPLQNPDGYNKPRGGNPS